MVRTGARNKDRRRRKTVPCSSCLAPCLICFLAEGWTDGWERVTQGKRTGWHIRFFDLEPLLDLSLKCAFNRSLAGNITEKIYLTAYFGNISFVFDCSPSAVCWYHQCWHACRLQPSQKHTEEIKPNTMTRISDRLDGVSRQLKKQLSLYKWCQRLTFLPPNFGISLFLKLYVSVTVSDNENKSMAFIAQCKS